jgi:tetratricopeptide (TPR) repeat protein
MIREVNIHYLIYFMTMFDNINSRSNDHNNISPAQNITAEAALWWRQEFLDQQSQAIVNYSQRLQQKPTKDVVALVGRGTAHLQLKQYQQAFKDFETALTLNPSYIPAMLGCGQVYNHWHRYAEAVENFNQAIRLSSSAATLESEPQALLISPASTVQPANFIIEAYIGRAEALRELELFEQALADVKYALTFSSTNVSALNILSTIYALEPFKKFSQAFLYIEQAWQSAKTLPEIVETYLAQATIYYYQGKYREVITIFIPEIYKFEPESVQAFNLSGLSNLELERSEQAISEFNRAINQDPRYWLYYHNRGVAYRRLNQTGKALVDFEQALKLNKESYRTYLECATIYAAEGGEHTNDEQALFEFAQALSLQPNKATAYALRAAFFESRKKYELAIKDCDSWLRLEPDNNVECLVLRAFSYFTLKKYSEARSDFNFILAIQPQHKQALYYLVQTLGYLSHQLSFYGERTQVVIVCNKFLRLYSEDAEAKKVLEIRGNAYRSLNLYQQAARDYEQASKLYSEDTPKTVKAKLASLGGRPFKIMLLDSQGYIGFFSILFSIITFILLFAPNGVGIFFAVFFYLIWFLLLGAALVSYLDSKDRALITIRKADLK